MTTGRGPRLIRLNQMETTRYGRNRAITSEVDMTPIVARSATAGTTAVRMGHTVRALITPGL